MPSDDEGGALPITESLPVSCGALRASPDEQTVSWVVDGGCKYFCVDKELGWIR
jgi:hypothetical protein